MLMGPAGTATEVRSKRRPGSIVIAPPDVGGRTAGGMGVGAGGASVAVGAGISGRGVSVGAAVGTIVAVGEGASDGLDEAVGAFSLSPEHAVSRRIVPNTKGMWYRIT
jgi:hypothetical protein